jgi:phosphatidylglycerol:prolipoprotein diacylglycerol transferase
VTLGFLFTALGYGVGALVFFLAARERRLATEGIGRVALAGFVGGILGAKLTEWALGHGDVFYRHPLAMFDPRFGGRTILGGVVIGWLAVEVAKRRLGLRRSTGDLFALALPAGEAVGRVGCLFNGCCYGVPARVPWAIHQHGEWRHPAQVYLSLTAALIFFVLFALRRRMRREGDPFKLYLALFGGSRFALEFYRERSLAAWSLSLAQWGCRELVAVAGAGLWVSARRARPVQPMEV